MKNKVYLLLGGIIILLLSLGGAAFTAARLNLQTIYQLESINKELLDSLKTYKNKFGEAVVQKAAAEANFELLKQSYGDKFDWIKDHMGIQEKNVKGIFNIVSSSTGHGEGRVDTVTTVRDGKPLTGLAVSDSTKWFKIDGIALPNRFTYTYTTYDDITLVPYKEGRNTFVRGISKNPNTSITGLQGILVATEPKNKRWGIGPSIQIGYDTQVRIIPGISVQYSLIRF